MKDGRRKDAVEREGKKLWKEERGKKREKRREREKGERGVRSILRIFMNSKLESEVASEKRHEVLFLLLSFFRLQLKGKEEEGKRK